VRHRRRALKDEMASAVEAPPARLLSVFSTILSRDEWTPIHASLLA
jgi:hypothetical protein